MSVGPQMASQVSSVRGRFGTRSGEGNMGGSRVTDEDVGLCVGTTQPQPTADSHHKLGKAENPLPIEPLQGVQPSHAFISARRNSFWTSGL